MSISAVDYKPRITKMWGTMLQMYSGVAKLRMEWNLLSLVPCPTKFLALKGHINFIQLLKGQMTNTHHIKMELFSQQRVFIGYFKVTWLLIMKLFRAKIWVAKITKSMHQRVTVHCSLRLPLYANKAWLRVAWWWHLVVSPFLKVIHGFEMAIFSRFADLLPTRICQPCGRENFQKHSNKNCLVYNPQVQHPRAYVLATHFFESLTKEAVHQLQPGIF